MLTRQLCHSTDNSSKRERSHRKREVTPKTRTLTPETRSHTGNENTHTGNAPALVDPDDVSAPPISTAALLVSPHRRQAHAQ